MSEHYLGDGLYAKFDGYGIELYTGREEGRHWVYLEPQVYAALAHHVKMIYGEAYERTR